MQPSKDIAALQRRNDELANEVGKLTKQITTISSGKTSLSTENRSLQERNKSLEATVTQVQLYTSLVILYVCTCMYCTCVAIIHTYTLKPQHSKIKLNQISKSVKLSKWTTVWNCIAYIL